MLGVSDLTMFTQMLEKSGDDYVMEARDGMHYVSVDEVVFGFDNDGGFEGIMEAQDE